MVSYIKSFFSYFTAQPDEDDDCDKENFLAEQLVDLEVTNQPYHNDVQENSSEIPRDAICFQKTGMDTYYFSYFGEMVSILSSILVEMD